MCYGEVRFLRARFFKHRSFVFVPVWHLASQKSGGSDGLMAANCGVETPPYSQPSVIRAGGDVYAYQLTEGRLIETVENINITTAWRVCLMSDWW